MDLGDRHGVSQQHGRFEDNARTARSSSRQRRGERRVLRDAVARSAPAARRVIAGRSMPSTWPSRTTVVPPTISSLMWRAVVRANSRSSGSRSGAQALGVERIPVEQQDIGRRAGRERAAVVLVGDRAAAVHRNAIRGSAARSTSVVKPVPWCSKMRKPHLAQRVVVLVERRAVEPERDAAAALDHLRQRRDAGAQMQVRAGVDRDRRRRARRSARVRPAAPRCNARASAAG